MCSRCPLPHCTGILLSQNFPKPEKCSNDWRHNSNDCFRVGIGAMLQIIPYQMQIINLCHPKLQHYFWERWLIFKSLVGLNWYKEPLLLKYWKIRFWYFWRVPVNFLLLDIDNNKKVENIELIKSVYVFGLGVGLSFFFNIAPSVSTWICPFEKLSYHICTSVENMYSFISLQYLKWKRL